MPTKVENVTFDYLTVGDKVIDTSAWFTDNVEQSTTNCTLNTSQPQLKVMNGTSEIPSSVWTLVINYDSSSKVMTLTNFERAIQYLGVNVQLMF